jgi:NAD(P)-dependent dehydrogenase (short-subunit alcohol dehydrogenase family)
MGWALDMEDKNTSAKKVAVVTGSATGIGYETAVYLARNGFNTYATMRNTEKSEDINTIAEREKIPISILQLDVTDVDSINAAIDTVIKQNGRIDVLVNNAGYGLFGSIEDMSMEELKAQYETNVFGLFRVTQAVIPHMRKQHTGAIINISSLAGRVGMPLSSAYVSTKFALEGLSESMAYELLPFGIKVAVIEPGAIKTRFRSEQPAQVADSPYASMTLLTLQALEGMVKQGISPKEVAQVVIDAINNPNPKLRYVVGKDAEEIIQASRKLPEQELFHTISQAILKKG